MRADTTARFFEFLAARDNAISYMAEQSRREFFITRDKEDRVDFAK